VALESDFNSHCESVLKINKCVFPQLVRDCKDRTFFPDKKFLLCTKRFNNQLHL